MQEEITRSRRGFMASLLGLAAVAAVGGSALLAPTSAEAAVPPPAPGPAKAPEAAPEVAPERELPKHEPTYWVRRRYYRPRRRVVYVRPRRYYRRRIYY